MNREYYKLWYRLDRKDVFLLWFTDEEDGFVINSNGQIPGFKQDKDLLSHAESLGLNVDVKDAALFDLDKIQKWLQQPKAGLVDCVEFLNAWNLMQDISQSVNGDFNKARKKTKKIYEKLFWGNNISAITPEGKSYEPIWTVNEVKIIQEILKSGLTLLRDSVVVNN